MGDRYSFDMARAAGEIISTVGPGTGRSGERCLKKVPKPERETRRAADAFTSTVAYCDSTGLQPSNPRDRSAVQSDQLCRRAPIPNSLLLTTRIGSCPSEARLDEVGG